MLNCVGIYFVNGVLAMVLLCYDFGRNRLMSVACCNLRK